MYMTDYYGFIYGSWLLFKELILSIDVLVNQVSRER